MKIRLAASLQKDSIADGEGIRAVLWTQGCLHNCKGCHNPSTHSFSDGALVELDEVYSWIDELEGHDGITLSGGDPMYQPLACLNIAKYAHKKGLNVWCYTGFTFEQLLEKANEDINILNFLKNIDVLVDGPFIIEQKSLDIKFRGSRNQRVIDVAKSLIDEKVIILKGYDVEKEKSSPLQRKFMYI